MKNFFEVWGMLFVFGGPFALIIIIFVFKSGSASKRTQMFEQIASNYSYEDAEREFEKNSYLVIDQMTDPLNAPISNKQAQELIEQMVALKNRMNELKGLEFGPSFRRGYRFRLLKQMKEASDRLSKF